MYRSDEIFTLLKVITARSCDKGEVAEIIFVEVYVIWGKRRIQSMFREWPASNCYSLVCTIKNETSLIVYGDLQEIRIWIILLP